MSERDRVINHEGEKESQRQAKKQKKKKKEFLDSLAYLDLFKEPISLKLDGRKSIGTSVGGLATLFTIIFFSIAMLFKIDHMNTYKALVQSRETSLESGSGTRRRLGGDPSRPNGGDDFNSTKNFRFEEKIDVDFKTMNYTHAVDAFKTNIDSIDIIFNHGDNREMVEEEMYLIQGKVNESIRQLDMDDAKNLFLDNIQDEDCYLLFQLTTTYIDPINGKERKRRLRSKDPRLLQTVLNDTATD